MSESTDEWEKRLRFAALPGAVRVEFVWNADPEGSSFALRCYDEDGQAIGDGTDYDILKARISPLQDLAEREGFADKFAKRSVSLDLSNGRVTKSWSAAI